MIVEKPLNPKGDVFWLASIDSVFGPLLKLSWLGDEDLVEICHDLNKERLYPLGWCQMNKVKLEPPKRIADMCPLWPTLAKEYLENPLFDSISMHFIDGEGVTPLERIQSGMTVSLKDPLDCRKTTDVEIKENLGGLLKFENMEEWIFYSSPRISQPKDVSKAKKRPPKDLVKPHKAKHDLQKDDVLEAIVNGEAQKACVQNIDISEGTIELKLLDKEGEVLIWNHVYDLAPLGTFLKEDQSSSAKLPKLDPACDHGFESGQKLLYLYQNQEFHSCTILDTKLHFIILQLDTKKDVQVIVSIYDTAIFPHSWCQTNGIEFHIPKSYIPKSEFPIIEEEPVVKKQPEKANRNDQGSWCPPIYFNYKCYSASFLSKARLAGLPKKVGPGPVHLVIREVLHLIIGSSFKSGSVLRRLEVKTDIVPANFIVEELKGKSRVVNLKAKIEIPTKADQVEKYLREMCGKLSACPHLVSTQIYESICPADCHNRPKADFKEDDSVPNNGSNIGKTDFSLPLEFLSVKSKLNHYFCRKNGIKGTKKERS